jgi:cellulose synthase/poly-beta-1,6-N-acetylglucosamine synthase-like glycosyltransferase
VVVAEAVFWVALAALVWTHGLYPFAVAAGGRWCERMIAKSDVTPSVTVVVAAHNEESVIARRIENLCALDYPKERLRIVVSSDASTDRTEEIASSFDGVSVVANPRGGKVAAQDNAVRMSTSDIVAFSDANATWAPDALRKLVRSFSDPAVAYVCGQLRVLTADGSNREGVYWRYEMVQRLGESRLLSVTGGNGSIYALRRSDYVEVDPLFVHDLALPYLMVQHGRRAVYEPEAQAFEKPTPTNETEYRRKVRMFEHCWLILLRGRMLRGVGPLYAIELVSHRVLRYGSGIAHLVLLVTSVALVDQGRVYDVVLGAQLALLLAALAGVAIARYYVLVTAATLVALWNYVRRGVPATWAVAEGTR